jgi:hypothetical protein
MVASIFQRRWYHWFHPNDTPEERNLICKLDLLVVSYAFVVYWVSKKSTAGLSQCQSLPLLCLESFAPSG